jgi:YggT family protein
MFVLSNFLIALPNLLNFAITILWWLIIIRALISWVNPDPYNPVVQFLYKTTDPFLYPFRRIIPVYNIGIDLSPLFAILVLYFAPLFIVKTLIDIAYHLR